MPIFQVPTNYTLIRLQLITHYHVGQYLSKIFQLLTINDYNTKDSFDDGNQIKNIPKELFDAGYRLVLFDVESLFTNVPLQRSINVMLKRIYDDKLNPY